MLIPDSEHEVICMQLGSKASYITRIYAHFQYTRTFISAIKDVSGGSTQAMIVIDNILRMSYMPDPHLILTIMCVWGPILLEGALNA